MGYYDSFDMSFRIMSIIVPIIFVIVFGLVIVVFIKSLAQWNKNNHSPRLTVEAKLVSKRTNTTHHHNGSDMSMSHTSTTYYATFQVESGDRMEFLISGQEYGMLVEGDAGRLTFQGTRYLGFERNY